LIFFSGNLRFLWREREKGEGEGEVEVEGRRGRRPGDQGILISLSGGEVKVWGTNFSSKPPVGCPDKVNF
jgi:hypothetical protein